MCFFNRQVLLVVVLLCFCGCKESKVKDNIREELLRNALLANSDFRCYDCQSSSDESFNQAISEAAFVVREKHDDSLGVRMSLHYFSNGVSGTNPNVIVYVKLPEFEYAFIFNDENIYLEQPFLQNSDRNQLEYQLNTIAARLHITNIGNEEKVRQLVEFFFSELLNCQSVDVMLANKLEGEMAKTLEFVNENVKDSCEVNYPGNFRRIRNEIENESINYFLTHKGINSFWRIGIDTLNNKLIIKPTLENYQCYTSIGI